MEEAQNVASAPELTPEPTAVDEGVKLPDSQVNESSADLQTKLGLFNMLDIDMVNLNDDDTNAKIQDILDWGKLSGISSDQLLIALGELYSKVGRRADRSRFESVWEWVRLDGEMKQMKLRQKNLEVNNV